MTKMIDFTSFEAGDTVEIELKPLSSYKWIHGKPSPYLDMRDVELIMVGSDTGVVEEAYVAQIRIKSLATQLSYCWARDNLLSIRCVKPADPRSIDSTFSLKRRSWDDAEFSFRTHSGKITCEVDSSEESDSWDGELSWSFIRWLAFEFDLTHERDTDSLVAFPPFKLSVCHNNQFTPATKTLKFGCWPEIEQDEIIRFLNWAMERAPV